MVVLVLNQNVDTWQLDAIELLSVLKGLQWTGEKTGR